MDIPSRRPGSRRWLAAFRHPAGGVNLAVRRAQSYLGAAATEAWTAHIQSVLLDFVSAKAELNKRG
jgi:hypothetical protein